MDGIWEVTGAGICVFPITKNEMFLKTIGVQDGFLWIQRLSDKLFHSHAIDFIKWNGK